MFLFCFVFFFPPNSILRRFLLWMLHVCSLVKIPSFATRVALFLFKCGVGPDVFLQSFILQWTPATLIYFQWRIASSRGSGSTPDLLRFAKSLFTEAMFWMSPSLLQPWMDKLYQNQNRVYYQVGWTHKEFALVWLVLRRTAAGVELCYVKVSPSLNSSSFSCPWPPRPPPHPI